MWRGLQLLLLNLATEEDAMDTDCEVVLLMGAYLVYLLMKENGQRRRRVRVTPYLMERNSKGRYNTTVSISATKKTSVLFVYTQ